MTKLRYRTRRVLSANLNLNRRRISLHLMPLRRAQRRSSSTSCLFSHVASVIRPLSKSSETLIVAVLVGAVAFWSRVLGCSPTASSTAFLFRAGWLPGGSPPAGLFRVGCPPAACWLFAGALGASLNGARSRDCKLPGG